jgi:RHS repeat-associated protein
MFRRDPIATPIATLDGETSTVTTNGPAPIAVYLYAGDQIIENVTMGYFYYQDSLGNTSHITDTVGNLKERYTYSAFGTPTVVSWTGSAWDELHPRNSSNYGIHHLFQGQLWTPETGLNDYRNRVELPTMGVFLQPDPIGFKGDAANIYRFCNNNAVNRTDPMGLLQLTASTWNHQTWMQGGSLLSCDQFDAVRQGAGRLSWTIAVIGGGADGARAKGGDSGSQGPTANNSPRQNQPGVPDYAIRDINNAYPIKDGNTYWAKIFGE